MLVLLCRMLLNMLFQIFGKYKYAPDINCYDTNADHRQQVFIFLLLAKSIMQILPISVVLVIYKPDI
jgi:hypothetical protein